MSDVIDLMPSIRRKKLTECEHLIVEVDDEVASLTCEACGHEIDPWSFLRDLARRGDREQLRLDAVAGRLADAEREANKRIASMNARLESMHKEVCRLTDLKNRLWNEQVNGQPLGAHVRRRRTRSAATP